MAIEIPPKADFTGRILALSPSGPQRFQCYGFSLGPLHPFATVTSNANHERLQQAVLEGRLIDVTNQNVDGFKQGESQHTAPQTGEDAGKVFISVGSDGTIMMTTPRDAEHEAELDKLVQETGHVPVGDYKISDDFADAARSRVNPSQANDLLNTMANNLNKRG